MNRTAVLAALLAGFVFLGVASSDRHAAAAGRVRGGHGGTFVAVLPDIGTVYVRYGCTDHGEFALGIHIPVVTATTEVRFRAGSFSRDRTVQPGDPTTWFRYTTSRVEWLAAVAGGENGNVVGSVRVVGYPSDRRCYYGYDPPRATVQTYPRRQYYGRGILRRLIG